MKEKRIKIGVISKYRSDSEDEIEKRFYPSLLWISLKYVN